MSITIYIYGYQILTLHCVLKIVCFDPTIKRIREFMGCSLTQAGELEALFRLARLEK
jgi:hypothetical protein